MKLVKTASGKNKIKMSKKEWTDLGKQAGWMESTDGIDILDNFTINDGSQDRTLDWDIHCKKCRSTNVDSDGKGNNNCNDCGYEFFSHCTSH